MTDPRLTRIYAWLYFRVYSVYTWWYYPIRFDDVPPHVEGEKGHFTKGEKVSLTILAAIAIVIVLLFVLIGIDSDWSFMRNTSEAWQFCKARDWSDWTRCLLGY